jgi:hypothetical protein
MDIGPVQTSVDTRKTIPMSPLAIALVLVGGTVLIAVGARKSS